MQGEEGEEGVRARLRAAARGLGEGTDSQATEETDQQGWRRSGGICRVLPTLAGEGGR